MLKRITEVVISAILHAFLKIDIYIISAKHDKSQQNLSLNWALLFVQRISLEFYTSFVFI